MSEYVVKCPYCGTALMLQSDWIGTDIECSRCGHKFKAASPKEMQNSVNRVSRVVELNQSNNSQPDTFNFICPSCNTVAKLPNSMQGSVYECNACCEKSIAAPSSDRLCPYCNGTIKMNATVCKHCKQIISPSSNLAMGCNTSPPSNGNIYGMSGANVYSNMQPYPFNIQPNTNYGTNITVIQENGNRNGFSPSYPTRGNTYTQGNSINAKSRVTYILLGWFLGAFGIHNFYAGYTTQGILQILLTIVNYVFIAAGVIDDSLDPLIISLFGCLVSLIWIIIDICTTREDANGIPFCK